MAALGDIALELVEVVGVDAIVQDDVRRYLRDDTEARNLVGTCSAVVRPDSVEAVVSLVRWSNERNVPLVPRGGGTGYAGGAVPLGGVVVSLERLNKVRAFDPLLWRMHVEAGVVTSRIHGIARDSGLYYPPDPGSSEQSQIGGNVATDAGGPHTFKYGTTGAWVTGVEAVVSPGEIVHLGGPVRKDVAGYDLRRLLIGSEGTLGIVTAVWLRLIPAPEDRRPVVAFYDDTETGVAAIEAVLGNGILASAIEYVDRGALAAAPAPFSGNGRSAGFAVLAEVDGTVAETERLATDLAEVLADGARTVHAPDSATAVAEVWRWRDGMTAGVTAQRGGKVSEDIVVPLDKLREALDGTIAIGRRHSLPACSWGHAGDGNLHSTFLIDPGNDAELAAAEAAAEDLFALALDLGGSISGEHGIGLTKSGHLSDQWPGRGYELHSGVKALFDPKNLLNPGKKL